MGKSKLYEKLDLDKYGHYEHQTSVIIKLKDMAYIKKNYHGLRNFIEEMVRLDQNRKIMAKNG